MSDTILIVCDVAAPIDKEFCDEMLVCSRFVVIDLTTIRQYQNHQVKHSICDQFTLILFFKSREEKLFVCQRYSVSVSAKKLR